MPVWGHIGLIPQHVKRISRYQRAGVGADAGCFALLVELVAPAPPIPVIGIGAGPHVDEQLLVCTDLLGLTPDFVSGFAKKFAAGSPGIRGGLAASTRAVRDRTFP